MIYIYDLNNNENYNIVGFSKNSLVYGDKINTIGNEILYNVQMNVTGKISDHYSGEIYNIKTKQMDKYQRSVDIIQTEKYFGMIKFDDTDPLSTMHLILYNK